MFLTFVLIQSKHRAGSCAYICLDTFNYYAMSVLEMDLSVRLNIHSSKYQLPITLANLCIFTSCASINLFTLSK